MRLSQYVAWASLAAAIGIAVYIVVHYHHIPSWSAFVGAAWVGMQSLFRAVWPGALDSLTEFARAVFGAIRKSLTAHGASGTAPVTSAPGVPARGEYDAPVGATPWEGRNRMNFKLILASVLAGAFHANSNVFIKLSALKAYSQLMGTAAATALVESDPETAPYAAGIIAGIGGNVSEAISTAQAAGLVGPALLTAAITDGQTLLNKEIAQLDSNAGVDAAIETIADPVLKAAITDAYNHIVGSPAVAAAASAPLTTGGSTTSVTQGEAAVATGEAPPA